MEIAFVAGVIAAVAVGTSRINEEIRGHVERAVAASKFVDQISSSLHSRYGDGRTG